MSLLKNIQLSDESLTIMETAQVLRCLSIDKVNTAEEIEAVNILCSGFSFDTYKTLKDLEQEAFNLWSLQSEYCLDLELSKKDICTAYNAVFCTFHKTSMKEIVGTFNFSI